MVKINSENVVKKIHNFWSNIHFHPTDAAEDIWGRRILDNVAKDNVAKCVRLYVMTEDMVSEDENGNLQYDYTVSDKRLDYMVEMGFDLLLCFAYTPMCMASDKLCVSEYLRYKDKRINTSAPKSFGQWEEVCFEYTKHLAERYGAERVGKWYFHCWNEPDWKYFWMSDCDDENLKQQNYFKLYDAFAKGVRKASETVKIGGPSLAFPTDFLRNFLRHIKNTYGAHSNNFNFLSVHTYGDFPNDLEKTKNINPENAMNKFLVYCRIAEEEGFGGIEIINDEWEACSNGFSNTDEYKCLEYRNTEKFSAHFISLIDCYLKNNIDISKMMICLSGQHNLKREFEGYRSFFTMSGFKKPIYNAYVLSAMLGNIMIGCENDDKIGVIPTKDDDGNIIIALYYTDSRLSVRLENKLIRLNVKLSDGKYTACHLRLDGDNCNSYAEWCRCGKPENPDQAERERIFEAGELKPWYADDNVYSGEYETDILMTHDSVSFIKLTKCK